MILAIVTSLRHLLGWVAIAFRSREDLIFENLALRQQLLALHAKRPRRSIDSSAQAVLDRLENVLVGVDEASRLGYSSNRGAVASGWLPVVLDLGFKAWTSGGTETGEQASSCSDLSNGYRESNPARHW
jgi:hypothetical protein